MAFPRTGALLRKGTTGLTAPQLKELLDNAGKLDEIKDEIEERRAVFAGAEAKAKARCDDAEKAEAAVAEREQALTAAHKSLARDEADFKADHAAGMEALRRRTLEVEGREKNADGRDEALDARESGLESLARKRETEFAEREQNIEAREAALDEREQDALAREAAIVAAESRISARVAQTAALWRVPPRPERSLDADDDSEDD